MSEIMVKSAKVAIGVDIIEIGRIQRAISRWQNSFLSRIYTEAELEGHRSASSLAARFAAKEAVMKALGTGTRGVNWREVEVLENGNGAPRIILHGRASVRCQEMGIGEFCVSMSHSRKYAIAFVMGYAA
jgi:holo-[acyl-carrier protein] synthase